MRVRRTYTVASLAQQIKVTHDSVLKTQKSYCTAPNHFLFGYRRPFTMVVLSPRVPHTHTARPCWSLATSLASPEPPSRRAHDSRIPISTTTRNSVAFLCCICHLLHQCAAMLCSCFHGGLPVHSFHGWLAASGLRDHVPPSHAEISTTTPPGTPLLCFCLLHECSACTNVQFFMAHHYGGTSC